MPLPHDLKNYRAPGAFDLFSEEERSLIPWILLAAALVTDLVARYA